MSDDQDDEARASGGPIAYVDGKVVDLADARIPLDDRGYLLGDGVFETLRVCDGRPFVPELHRRRLVEGLAAIGLDETAASAYDVAVAALLFEGRRRIGVDLQLRVQVSTGRMDGIVQDDPRILVTGIARPFMPYPRDLLDNGVDLVMTDVVKRRGDRLATTKSLSFLPYVSARRQAVAAGAHDGLLGNDAGRIAEASTSNVFAVQDGRLHAPGPSEAALAGTMREVVLALVAAADGAPGGRELEVVPDLPLAALASADEAWLTNTTGGVVPVRSVDGHALAHPKGPWATWLQHRVEELVRGP